MIDKKITSANKQNYTIVFTKKGNEIMIIAKIIKGFDYALVL